MTGDDLICMPTKTAAKPAARRSTAASSTRSARLATSAKHGAAWVFVWHVAVVWRDSTWPVAHTAITAVQAMAGSVV